MIQKILARLDKEHKKGFTLVELIVVLVILAILAAILVPALLGWIDKAKEKQILVEARNAYMAAQAVVSEDYAKQNPIITDDITSTNELDEELAVYLIAEIEEMAELSDGTGVGMIELDHHKVVGLTYVNDDAGLAAILHNGVWEIVPY